MASWLFLEHTSHLIVDFPYLDALPQDENMIYSSISFMSLLSCYLLLSHSLTTQRDLCHLPPTGTAYPFSHYFFPYYYCHRHTLFILLIYCLCSPLECKLHEGKVFYMPNKYMLNQCMGSQGFLLFLGNKKRKQNRQSCEYTKN